MNWTDEQKMVIDSRGENLLVSAAAGSGKTAVLVERILQKIADPRDNISINELLIVTFTRAAASEMRDRISRRLLQMLEEDPENIHLQRQLPLLSQARISTIDSFCGWVVKNYFQELEIDPDFRILEEGEEKLLREEILDALLEDAYGKAEEDFLHFAGAFSGVNGDRNLRDLVLRCHTFSESEPWPEEWLEAQMEKAAAAVQGPRDWERSMQEGLQGKIRRLENLLHAALADAEAEEGLQPYADMLRADIGLAEDLLRRDSLESLLEGLRGMKFVRKPRLSAKLAFSEEKQKEISALRDLVKDGLQRLNRRYGTCSTEEEAESAASTDQQVLLKLTLEFGRRYRAEKARKNLANFSDVEHWALELLVDHGDGEIRPTALAEDLGSTFREIMIDEYQDSNLVQETILSALSGERRGDPNMFMVGDVKQSIYKFRMARPELFMEKYKRFHYGKGPGAGRKIDLGRNFRSRESVLGSVNRVFGRLMGEGLGGVEYDEHAMLYYNEGGYPKPDPPVELLICETGEENEETQVLEAGIAAARIRELMAPESEFRLWDAANNCWRRPEYRDFAILLRSMENWAETFVQVLNQAGIPAYAQLKTGYFAAREVQVLLNFLAMLDNPLQDIPVMSVLLSPIGGFTAGEAALMVAGQPDGPVWERLRQGAAEGICREKWLKFEGMVEEYRSLTPLLPIHELLERILSETDYRLILGASADGRVRLANVDMLLDQAMRYEETNFHGIFQFLQYMKQLKRYQMDFGEGQALSEQDNLVRITSIHKSKGLEYPVVIVAGCGKQFNLMDCSASMLIHEELGLACDGIDPEDGISTPLLYKKYVSDRMAEEVKGEELRILYVAMTRAKEKLILTGSVKDFGTALASCSFAAAEKTEKLPPAALMSANSALQWLLMSAAGQKEPPFEIRVTEGGAPEEGSEGIREMDVLRLETARAAAEGEPSGGRWQELLSYRYPWESVARLGWAYSVTDLKKAAGEETIFPEEEAVPAARRLLGDGSYSGAARGTAFHLVLETLPPEEGDDPVKIRRHMEKLVEKGQLSSKDARLVRRDQIARYYRSYLGRIAAGAQKEGRLYREQYFIMQVPLEEVLKETDPEFAGVPEGETVLVQGKVDIFADTDRGLILWDYKTDRVPEQGGEEFLLGRYAGQLHRYRDALEKAVGKKVAEMWIYSFALEKEIRVE